MNSLRLFKLRQISSLSYLKSVNGVSMSTKPRQMLFDSHLMSKLAYPVQIQSRSFWETFPSPVLSLHVKDGLKKEDYDIVYKSKLFNYAFYSQLFSISGFFVITVYSSYNAFKSIVYNEVVQNTATWGPYTTHHDILYLFAIVVFSCQNAFLYYLSQRAVLRVYHQKELDKYVVVTLSYNPFKSRLIHCKPGELLPLNIEGVASIFGNHKLCGNKLFVRYNGFKNLYYYNRLTNPLFS